MPFTHDWLELKQRVVATFKLDSHQEMQLTYHDTDGDLCTVTQQMDLDAALEWFQGRKSLKLLLSPAKHIQPHAALNPVVSDPSVAISAKEEKTPSEKPPTIKEDIAFVSHTHGPIQAYVIGTSSIFVFACMMTILGVMFGKETNSGFVLIMVFIFMLYILMVFTGISFLMEQNGISSSWGDEDAWKKCRNQHIAALDRIKAELLQQVEHMIADPTAAEACKNQEIAVSVHGGHWKAARLDHITRIREDHHCIEFHCGANHHAEVLENVRTGKKRSATKWFCVWNGNVEETIRVIHMISW
jgi:hypothetical protein